MVADETTEEEERAEGSRPKKKSRQMVAAPPKPPEQRDWRERIHGMYSVQLAKGATRLCLNIVVSRQGNPSENAAFSNKRHNYVG